MRFFQGSSIYGPVRVSSARTFRDIVDMFRICPTIPIAREAFHNKPKDERDQLKQVPFFVPATFKTSPCERQLRHAKTCNLIFLDIDTTKDGKSPAAPFCNAPQTLFTALQRLNFAAYTTANSTLRKPRMRIVVEANEIPLAMYAAAVGTIAAMLGLPSVTRESEVAVQPMFLPTQFADSTEEDHPLLAHRVDGRALQVADISENSFTGSVELKNPVDHGLDALLFLKSPVPEVTLSIAREALAEIDPDCSYFEWLECAAALRHQFSPHRAEEAYTLFDEWSQKGTKYSGEKETRLKWDSLKSTPVGRLPVTIRSLLRLAVSSGWDDKKLKSTCFEELVKWLEEGASNVVELTEKGVQKVVAAPLLSAMQEDLLMHTLCKQAKLRFAHSVSVTAIRKDINRLKAAIRAQEKKEKEESEFREPLWVKGVCYVSRTKHFFRQRTGEFFQVESFNATYSRWLLPTEEMLKEAGVAVSAGALATPLVRPADYALNSLKIPTVYDYDYDPAQPGELFFVREGMKYVNVYFPTFPEMDNARAEEAGALITGHLQRLIAEKEYQNVIADFLAYQVQFPGRKIRWAPLIQSAEGAGKTFLAAVLQAALGRSHVAVIGDQAIKSGYNEWAFGRQVVVIEEIRVAGANRYEVMNALKPLVTNDTIPVNQKFRDQRNVRNVTNYLMFSNHHDALALTANDRRYFVLKSPLQSRRDVLALGENYFTELFSYMQQQPGAVRAWLANREISPSFRPDGHAPRTRYAQEMANDSANEITATVRRLLLEGDYPLIQYDIVSAKTLLDVIQLEEGVLRASAQQVAHVLREEGYWKIGRHTLGEERHYLWVRNGVNADHAALKAADRVLRNLKNLCMELIYE